MAKPNAGLTEMQDSRRAQYDIENKTAQIGQIDFVGSSLMEIFPIEQWQKTNDLGLDKIIYNRGVSGTVMTDLLEHLDTLIFDLAPCKIFINIGSNDIGAKITESAFLAHYDTILKQIKSELPETTIYMMAYYPIAKTGVQFDSRTNQDLLIANRWVSQLARDNQVHFINVNAGLTDQAGNLRPELTNDGAHLLPTGFEIILRNMMPYLI